MKIFRTLSCAFARSTRPRNYAWARLASFCASDLSFYRAFAQVLPLVALICEGDQVGFFQLVEHAPDPLGLVRNLVRSRPRRCP